MNKNTRNSHPVGLCFLIRVLAGWNAMVAIVMANVKLGLSAYIRLGCVIVVYFCCVVRGKISRRICLSIVKYLTISPSERKPALAFLFVFGSQRFWAFVGKALSSGLTSHPNLPTDNLNDAASYLQNRVCPRFVCSHVFCVLVFMRFNLDIYGLISGISLSARFCVLCFLSFSFAGIRSCVVKFR